MNLVERTYFNPGDLVKIKDLPGPTMKVKSVDKAHERNTEKQPVSNPKPVLIGIKCFWFTDTNSYEEKLFSSKDLVKV
jgi:uncharacterized protein YodC (DUF2158 family)